MQISTKKSSALLRKFQNIFPRAAFLSIYKILLRIHLNYGDIIYDQAFNSSSHKKIKSLKYNKN